VLIQALSLYGWYFAVVLAVGLAVGAVLVLVSWWKAQ
jgi:hypothetical protein